VSSWAAALRTSVVGGKGSVGEGFRQARWSLFRSTFPSVEQMSVIDLGGRADTWLRAPVRPRHVHLVNLETVLVDLPDWMSAEQGDACEMSESIGTDGYDLVFSNSVIEHVGGHQMRLKFARSVRRLAPRSWIQTPNRYFPIEPHFLGPGFQFLPVPVRSEIVSRWPLVHTPSRDRRDSLTAVLSTELLGVAELRYYFPESHILREKAGGWTKSLISVVAAESS